MKFYDEISPISMYVNLRVEVAAVSRNRYGVEKTVDTHKILINAIKFYVCLQETVNIHRRHPCFTNTILFSTQFRNN